MDSPAHRLDRLPDEKACDSAIAPALPIRLVDTCKEYYNITLWMRLLAHAQKGGALVIYVDTER